MESAKSSARMTIRAAGHAALSVRVWLVASVVFAVVVVAGCPTRQQPETDSGDVTPVADDQAQTSTAPGSVEFRGPEGVSVVVRNQDGKVVCASDLPCEAKLPAGNYSWSARYADNQKSDERNLTLLPGDDQKVQVTPPDRSQPRPEGEPEANLAPGTGAADINKPWLNTEPIVPTQKPQAGPAGNKGQTAKASEPTSKDASSDE